MDVSMVVTQRSWPRTESLASAKARKPTFDPRGTSPSLAAS